MGWAPAQAEASRRGHDRQRERYLHELCSLSVTLQAATSTGTCCDKAGCGSWKNQPSLSPPHPETFISRGASGSILRVPASRCKVRLRKFSHVRTGNIRIDHVAMHGENHIMHDAVPMRLRRRSAVQSLRSFTPTTPIDSDRPFTYQTTQRTRISQWV